MNQPEHRILRAWLTSATSGIIELDADWTAELLPLLAPGEKAYQLASLEPAAPEVYAEEAGYFVDAAGQLVFVLDPAEHAGVDFEKTPIYVGGDFNGWGETIGRPEWQLKKAKLLEREVWTLAAPTGAALLREPPLRFKFVTGDARWLALSPDATNSAPDGEGHVNRLLLRHRTGRNLFAFTTKAPLEPSRAYSVVHLRDGQQSPKIRLRLGKFFHALKSDLPLGAIVRKTETTFRLFAPRAKSVRVSLAEQPDAPGGPHIYELDKRLEDGVWRGVWEARLDQNLHGWFYWYNVSGPQNVFGNFHPNQRILDPYALASVGRTGPGIVLDRAWVGQGDRGFRTPAWQDLVVAEAHVRDLTARAPIELTPEERRGFAGLKKWVESPDFYLKRLGVNAVELQPIQEHDNAADEYQWGYMTTNWFAPASAYGTAPERAAQVKEFQELVAAFHRQGMAVILDVVYNHAGEPAHLMFIDKLYHFELGDDGSLTNWSGVGNDLRCRSAMTKRLIIDSLAHMIEAFGVDGFRFDLAELIGVGVLSDIEAALKKVKPDVILIAEPWSFRGHIADALRPTGFASWNDGYRNFLRDYVHAAGAADKLEYFLKGSPWHFAYWPAQTVNYTESHDDRTWLDVITENGDNNGFRPTANDVRRTHLMAAILFASIGIPMVSAGQDFLRSKHGVNNTYLRGDLNALDYRRLRRHAGTHAYFAEWIAFRRSHAGRLLRLWTRPSEGFFQAFAGPDGKSLALIYNADGSNGAHKLLFAVNPRQDDVTIAIGEWAEGKWRLVADHARFYERGTAPLGAVEPELFVPALGCALWVSGE